MSTTSTFGAQVRNALDGADFHLARVFACIRDRGPAHYDCVVFHLRAHYWELVATWDLILQRANELTLCGSPKDVRGDLLRVLAQRVPDWEYLSRLTAIADSSELRAIKRIRNHAHRWVLAPTQVALSSQDGRVLGIQIDLAPGHHPRADLVHIDGNEAQFMRNVVDELTGDGFFERGTEST